MTAVLMTAKIIILLIYYRESLMRFVLNILSIIIIAVFLQSCSNIKILNERDYYSDSFLKKMESIQLIYRDGDKQLALQKLKGINDETITSSEKAKKYNLMGVMLFSRRDLEGAIENFQIAKQLVGEDLFLASNIRLNLASSYFKQQKTELTLRTLKSIDEDYLKGKEKTSFHKLSFTAANQLNDHKTVVNSLLYLTHEIGSFKQFEDYKFKEILVDNFKKLGPSERVDILYNQYKTNKVVTAYLGKSEAMSRFYMGDREGSQDVVTWLESRFTGVEDVQSFINDYKFRVDNFSKINSGAIGVIVPLSGRVSKYGNKVVAGVNTAIANSKTDQTLNVYVKDNQNNTYLAKKQIQELVLKHHVSVIIGGLFPDLAKEEYLEARKYGVLYISLSQVYLPRSEKNHLLVEVSGSVESQIASILKPEVIEHFGKRVAVLYPWSDDGKSYINELWGLQNSNKIKLTNINYYKRGIDDYRESVKSLLGLKFPREREEELNIWRDIKNANKRNVRIVNMLPPVIDFDWVFIPSLPKEAIQILPTFSFFDAKDVKFVGGPSWINKRLQKERRNLGGQMYVIGSDTNDVNVDFMKLYKEHNGAYPHLVDTLSYEGMSIVLKILDKQNFSKREELGTRVREFAKFEGITSEWNLDGGLWIKEMDVLKIGSKSFTKINTKI
ncbi:MAG: ABC-type branched-subunit amino acid transport system substrate-binding protein [Bacteriovoracaceae bacterium]|jgi:ABC-type branched-subunit amino acid transport system substrate-binding protein